MKRILSVLAGCVLALFVCISVLLVFTARWFVKTFGLLTIDEIIYHMKTSIKGTNPEMIRDYLFGYGIWAILIAAVILIAYFRFARKAPKYRAVSCAVLIVISVLCLGIAYCTIDSAIGITEYIKQEVFSDPSNREDFVAEHFVDTSTVDIRFPEGAAKRNLIYIWLESMEATYADRANGGAFDVNMIPEMTALAEANENFSGDPTKLNGGIALPGADWTMGGMFAQTSGLPLKIPYASTLTYRDDFFPGIKTLGDILKEQGYNQTLLLGSEAEFGGMKLYFTCHGNYKTRDYKYAIEHGDIPEDYYVFWGYEDEKLYEYAKNELAELASQEQPFNLSMITIDTHFEDGYVCRLCQNEYGDNQYANVMACASRQLTSFIQWVQAQPFYANTTIVISGDHPTMDSDFCEDVSSDYQRKTYTCILNSAATRADDTTTRTFSTMDLFPTTLAAMGCTIDGDQLGLGVNLYSDKETLIEQYGISVMKSKLFGTSKMMNSLSGLEFGEDILNEAAEKINIVSSDEDGCIQFDVRRLGKRLKRETIDRLYFNVTFTDPKTGDKIEKTYDCDLILGTSTDPNAYVGRVLTDIPIDQLQSVDATLYITVGDYKDFELDKYSYKADQKYKMRKAEEAE